MPENPDFSVSLRQAQIHSLTPQAYALFRSQGSLGFCGKERISAVRYRYRLWS